MAGRHHMLATAVVLAVGLAPVRAHAAPRTPPPPPPPPPPAAELPPETPPEVAPVPSSAPTTTETDEVESVFDLGLEGDLPPAPEDPVAEDEPAASDEVEVGTEAKPAQTPAPPVRPPLTPTGKAGWSLLLASFAAGAGASVTIGLAERERSRQRRIGVAYDLFTTQPRALPDDVAQILDKSRRTRAQLTTVAIGLGGTAGGLLVTSVILLAVDKSKRKRAQQSVAVLPTAGGVTVRF